MADYIRKTAVKLGFSTGQQSAYGTALTATDITEAHPAEGGTIARTVDKKDDADQGGKGHEFPTKQTNQTATTSANYTYDLSSYIGALVTALANGQVITSQPDDVGSPLVYDHEVTMMDIDDPAIGKQLPVTTLVEHFNDNRQATFPDKAVKSFTLSGNSGEQIKLAADYIGSGRWGSSSITMPGLVPTSFLRFVDINVSWGGTDVSAKLKNFTFKHDNTFAEKDGYYPGSGYLNANPGAPQVRGRLLLSKRAVSCSFKLLLEDDDTFEADMLDNQSKSLTITAEGEPIGTYNHKMVLELPNTVLKATPMGEDDGFLVYDVETNILYHQAFLAPYKLTWTNNIESYLAVAT